ncbi:GNAT family N-acetyltransferase [Alkalihalobacillus pseudalcaliphilus]|uniref:GNAT family N-acetyltransferase n=1 Tax=Alkalihalobacillus pseudalcaliphilus TaxID=79884 RepID=UPI00064E13DC|nr:GNAT family N-acetyltransferase [Alkalihalobacillus pseudalcaliphilus]KMK75097.1 acetyltransferase [Alkalihalobacillus pseudalcaliphilus]
MKLHYQSLQRTKVQDIVKLWNQEIGTDFPMSERLLIQNSFSDHNLFHEGSYIVMNEQDELVGFIISKFFQEITEVSLSQNVGWIQVLVVHQNYRNQGIGSDLLIKAERAFQHQHIKEILLGRDPFHYFPGIPADYEQTILWFEKRGYEINEPYGRDYDMVRNFKEQEEVQRPNIEGISFSLLKLQEKELFLHFMKQNFPGRWQYEAHKYFEMGGVGREFVVVKKRGNIIGFCRINDYHSPMIAQNVYWSNLFERELGGIGPLGVAKEERKYGYGLAVVEAAVYFLRERGVESIVIDWTGLVTFYEKLGFKPWKSYRIVHKNMEVKELV